MKLIDRPLTFKQREALEAVAYGLYRHTTLRFGWRHVVRYVAQIGDITQQLQALRKKGLIHYAPRLRHAESPRFELTVAGAFELYFEAPR